MDLYKKIAELPPEKRELFELMLMEQGVDLSKVMIVPQGRENNRFPLSYSQQRLWFLDQLEPNSSLYNISPVIRLHGTLDRQALQDSFNEIVRRHEVLRTVFDKVDDDPVQIVQEVSELPLDFVSLTKLAPDLRESEMERLALEESRKPFDLNRGPLLRVKLLQLAEDDHVLVLVKHHIISDNWSTGIMVHELLQLYNAFHKKLPSPLEPLTVQYADFAHWQRKWLKGKTLENQVLYWREQLQDVPAILEMPIDKPRPAFQTYNGDYKLFHLPQNMAQALKNLARRQDATLFMVLTAIFKILLMRYSGQNDITVGTPIANRNRKETEALIGFFINTLVLRSRINAGDSFNSFLKQVREMTLAAYAHQDIPFETLVEEIQPQRDMSHSPFFQNMFVMNNARVDKLELPDLELELIELENKTSKFDLIFNVTETAEGLDFKVEFNTDLYFSQTIEHMIGHYTQLIHAVLADPDLEVDKLQMIRPAERKTILEDWSQPATNLSINQTVLELFNKTVATYPDKCAVRAGEQQLTYAELDARANQLATAMKSRGLQATQIAGVCLPRNADSLVAMLAVLKCGACYLPLDPAYPAERLQFMLQDSAAGLLCTSQALSTSFTDLNISKLLIEDAASGDHKELPALPKPAPGDAAYIIYTSGSTGQPKGVLVEHGPFAAHCVYMQNYYELTSDDNVLEFAALNFDAALEQIWPPLLSGATVVLRDDEIWDTARFSENIIKFNLSVINPPTAYWAQMAEDWQKNPQLLGENRIRLVIVGGDLLRPESLKLWHQTKLGHVRLLNAYGPTESIITASTFEVPERFERPRVPIGKARGNRRFYILDRAGNLQPQGIPGELYIGGDFLARGYLNNETLTAERFIADPFNEHPDSRMYKTGDRVCWREDGTVDFLGRVDFQVKIRGFRIELGEIETRLEEYAEVRACAVVAANDADGNKRLAAFYTAPKELPAEVLREHLNASLPDYMVPALFIHIEQLPLDPSGKVNRRLLPKADFSQVKQNEYVAPRSESEQILVDIVAEVLKIDRVGITDNFFDLGGHSMLATQIVSRIRDAFGVELSLRKMFENPTVEGIALSITEIKASYEDQEALEAMLDEIEDLSDEELNRLLNEENN